MKGVVACVVAFVTALCVGVGALALFFLGIHGDVSQVTGVYEPPFIYAGLPIVVSLALSMALAHWNFFAARVFGVVSVVVFFGPILELLFSLRNPRWGELIGFTLMAVLSLFANWWSASLVRRQLRQASTAPVNQHATQYDQQA
jgi:hypothetical protein